MGHLADVHLGARISGYEELELDVAEAFSAAVDALVREGAEVIVVSGDLFDRPRPPNRVLSQALKVARNVVEKGVPLVVALGDHDYPQRGDRSPVHLLAEAAGGGVYVTPERFSSAATPLQVVSDSTFRVKGANFTVLPFVKGAPERRRKTTGSLLEAAARLAGRLERPRILVAHLGLEGYTIPDDAVAGEGDLPPYDYAALGHVHRRHVRRIPRNGGSLVFAYPASLVPLRLDEVRALLQGEARGPLLVDLSGDEPVVHELEFEQPRLQAYLEAEAVSRRALVEAAARALAEAGRMVRASKSKTPLLHLVLRIPESSTLSPREAVAAIEGSLRVKVRLARVSAAPRPGSRGHALVEGSREEDVIRGLLDPQGRHPELAGELAGLIVRLKAAAARGDLEEVGLLLDEVLSERFDPVWRESLGSPRGLSRWLG